MDLDAKYLCKKLPPRDRENLELTGAEHGCLEGFRRMENVDRALLASYSHRLHGANKKRWDKWIGYPVDRQVQIARSGWRGAK